MRATLRNAVFAAVATLAMASVSRAQIGKAQIDAAKKAANATNEQTKAAEKVDQPQRQKAAQPPAKSAPAPQQKAGAPPQKGAPAPQQKGAPAPPQKGTQKAGAKPDTATGAVSQAGGRRGQVSILRETFTYSDGGRRDPFVSLMASGELRPIFTDLSLTGVVLDPDPRKSLALLVDVSTGESYRVRVGQTLGRMRVQRIGLADVTFSIDEFGLSRSETVTIDKTKKAGPAPARRP